MQWPALVRSCVGCVAQGLQGMQSAAPATSTSLPDNTPDSSQLCSLLDRLLPDVVR